jgi:hypothetical protein
MAAGKQQANRIAQGVNDGMDFRRQTAATTSDGLSIAPPFAPAEC